MVLMFLGALVFIAGIVLLIVRKKKGLGVILLAVGLLAAAAGFLWIGFVAEDDETGSDTGKTVVEDAFLDVPAVDGIKADEEKITFDAPYVSISIEPDDAGRELAPGESPAALHTGDTVEGVTEDGIAWSTDKADGTGTIHMNVNGKPVSATVKPKTDEKSGSKDKTDAGQAAAAVAALVNTGYKKGVDNYNHDYSIWYSEPAQCLVYYPAQLKLTAAYEDGSVVFTDSRSKAKLKVSLEENEFLSMDEVESLIADTEDDSVLALGNDWYSCETVGASMTEYSVTGLGQDYAVTAELTYENQYSFVFGELRRLIRCKFIEGGKWVSSAEDYQVGKASPALVNRYANGFEWKVTSWYFNDWDCYLDYPDVFTKAYKDDEDREIFTDPVTGAFILMSRDGFEGSLQDVVSAYALESHDITGEDSVRGYYHINDYKVYHFVLLRDGYEYHAVMYVPKEYADIYDAAAMDMRVVLPDDEYSSIEMQDIYYPDYKCYVTIPLQFEELGHTDTEYSYGDSHNGLELRVSFTSVTADTDTGNIFDMFDVVADDSNITVGNNVVKWHNQEGLFVAALGEHHAGMLEMTYPNAQTAYEKSWIRFNLRFDDSAKAETIADRIVQDIKVAKIVAESEKAKQDIAAASGKDHSKEKDKAGDEAPTAEPAGTGSEPGQEPVDMPSVSEAPTVTPAIIARPVNNTLPANSDWMYDEKQNVVLWYKDYEDYRNVSLTADAWFKSETLGFSNSHFFKWGTLAVINSVLRYNEYDIDVTAEWVKYDAVAEVNVLLEDRYGDPQAGSQLGDGIVSVFEAYCEVLGIDVPDYVSNAKEPGIEPAEPTAAPRPTMAPTLAPVPTAAPDDPEQQVIPDTGLSDEDKALLKKLDGHWEYADPETEVTFYLSETGNWIRRFNDYGDVTETAGRMLITDNGSIILCDWDLKEILYTLEYEEDMDYIYDSAYADFLVRVGEDEPGDDNGVHVQIPDEELYTRTLNAILERQGRHTEYEEVAAALGIGILGEPYMKASGFYDETYGNMSYVWFYEAYEQPFMDNLEEMGFKNEGDPQIGDPAWVYTGYLPGYEQYGKLHILIVNYSGSVNVIWSFENYDDLPYRKGDVHVRPEFAGSPYMSFVSGGQDIYSSGLALSKAGQNVNNMCCLLDAAGIDLDDYYIAVGTYWYPVESENTYRIDEAIYLYSYDPGQYDIGPDYIFGCPGGLYRVIDEDTTEEIFTNEEANRILVQ